MQRPWIYNKRKYYTLFPFLVFCLLLSGCATFQPPYPSRMASAKQELRKDQPQAAESTFISKFNKSGSLYALEQGRLLQLNDKPKISLQEYAQVIDTIRADRMKAKIQASKILENTGALLTNDRELPFETPDYAMTFLYAYQALNYLSLHDLSNALVSIRQLSQAQSWIQSQHQFTQAAQQKMRRENGNQGVNLNNLEFKDSPKIRSMYEQVKSVKNAYENGFSYYLASILYMAYGDYNDAMVSIKDAKRLLPDNPYVRETFKQIQKGFNGEPSLPSQHGRLIIIYESGFVEPMKAFQLPLPLGRLGLQMISVPYYSSYGVDDIHPFHTSIKTESGNHIIEHKPSALLVNTNQMAMKSLTEAYPAIITREVLRLILKSTATYTLQRESDKRHEVNWGLLLGSVYGIVTAKADQRSWLLLPKDIQLYTHPLKEGKYRLQINTHNYNIKINNQRTTLLWIVQIGEFYKKFYFEL